MTRLLAPRVPLRDSGIPWLGEIPAHWAATRLKFVADVQGGLTLGKNYGAATLMEYPYLRVANVQDGYLDLSDIATILVPETEAGSCLLKAGDVLMNEGGDADKLGRGCIWAGEIAPCLHQNHVFAVRPRLVSSEWLNAWTSTEIAKAFFESRAKQSTNLASISATNIKELPIPVPPADEQSTIVDYLDQETAQLDGLVAAKERVLGLVAEKRRALITRAVTRGLDPCPPLRDSGIPWLGEIPTHWTATRMKFLAIEPLAYGANEAALEDDPTFPRFVRITDVDSEGNLRDETFKSLPPEVAEPYLLRDGDILLARSGATVGKAFIYKPTWGIACFAGYLIRCRCNTVLMQPDFLFAYTQTEPYWWQVREGTIQATIQNFSAEKYGDLVVTVPPLEEQKAIIAYIAAETAKLDALRSATERTIALLKERRAALIAAAVTGRLHISEAA